MDYFVEWYVYFEKTSPGDQPHLTYRFPKIRGFNSKLARPSEIHLDRFSMLQLVTASHETLHQLAKELKLVFKACVNLAKKFLTVWLTPRTP